MAGLGVVNTLLAGGALMPGRAALDSLTLPPATAGTAGVVCALTTMHALAAVRQARPDDAAPALATAAELAQRFGATDTDPLGFILAPGAVGIERMWHYGCALAQLGRRHEDAVQALRTAERIYPTKMLRNRSVRGALAVLFKHSRRGSPADLELRGMARRARLLV